MFFQDSRVDDEEDENTVDDEEDDNGGRGSLLFLPAPPRRPRSSAAGNSTCRGPAHLWAIEDPEASSPDVEHGPGSNGSGQLDPVRTDELLPWILDSGLFLFKKEEKKKEKKKKRKKGPLNQGGHIKAKHRKSNFK